MMIKYILKAIGKIRLYNKGAAKVYVYFEMQTIAKQHSFLFKRLRRV